MSITIESGGSNKLWQYILMIAAAVLITVFVTYQLLDKKYDFKDLKKATENAIDSSSVIGKQIQEIESDKIITLDEIKDLKLKLDSLEQGLEKVKDEHPEQEGMTLEEALKIISG